MSDSIDNLLTNAVAGDQAAAVALLKECGPAVRARIAHRITGPWQALLDADDVMQVTYIEALLHLGRRRSNDVRAFRAWLQRAAKNNLSDAIRGLKCGKRPDPARRVESAAGDDTSTALLDLLAGNSSSPSRKAGRREAADLLMVAINQLPEDYAAVVKLYDLEGRPADAVAAALGRSEGAVYMLRARAHDRLRTALGSDSLYFTDRA